MPKERGLCAVNYRGAEAHVLSNWARLTVYHEKLSLLFFWMGPSHFDSSVRVEVVVVHALT